MVFGLAHGLIFPSLNAIAVTGVQAHERGRMMAIFIGSFNLGVWGGTTALGLLATFVGYELVFVATAGIGAVATVVCARSGPLRGDPTDQGRDRIAVPRWNAHRDIADAALPKSALEQA